MENKRLMLDIIALIDENSAGLDDMVRMLNVSKLRISNIINGLTENNYVIKQETQNISNNSIETYYILNKEKEADLFENYFDGEDAVKMGYIEKEVKNICNDIKAYGKMNSFLQMSTIKISIDNYNKIINKLHEVRNFILEIEKQENNSDDVKKCSVVLIGTIRDDF